MSSKPLKELLSQAFFTPVEIAAILRVSKLTVYKKINAGEIPAKKIDGRWILNRDELLKYLKERYGQGMEGSA